MNRPCWVVGALRMFDCEKKEMCGGVKRSLHRSSHEIEFNEWWNTETHIWDSIWIASRSVLIRLRIRSILICIESISDGRKTPFSDCWSFSMSFSQKDDTCLWRHLLPYISFLPGSTINIMLQRFAFFLSFFLFFPFNRFTLDYHRQSPFWLHDRPILQGQYLPMLIDCAVNGLKERIETLVSQPFSLFSDHSEILNIEAGRLTPKCPWKEREMDTIRCSPGSH